MFELAGRHGKLTGSPYHVITNRALAGEKYGNEVSQPKPLCKYRKNGVICTLPQNKKRYKKNCVFNKCKYLEKNEIVLREDCVYLINDKCIYSELLNCTGSEDLAYCCDYFLPIQDNMELHQKLKYKAKYEESYSTLIDRIKTLKSKQKYCVAMIKSNKQIYSDKRFNRLNKKLSRFAQVYNKILPANDEKKQFSITMLDELETEFMWFITTVSDNLSWISVYANVDVSRLYAALDCYQEAKQNYIKIIKK